MGQILVREYTHACVLWDAPVLCYTLSITVSGHSPTDIMNMRRAREKNGKEREVQEHLVEEAVDAVVHDRAEG